MHVSDPLHVINLDPIIAAVGEEPDSRDQLQSDLEGIRSLYRTGAESRGGKLTKRKQSADAIVAALEEAKRLIVDDNIWIGLWRWRFVLDRLITDVRKHVPDEELSSAVGVAEGSVFEALISHLSITFEQRFGMEPGYTRGTDSHKSGEITNPFIDFAEAVLADWGIARSREHIARTLSEVRGKSSK